MTAWYHIHASYRNIWHTQSRDITFKIKYNDKITLDLFDDFTNYCRDELEKARGHVVEFEILGWSRFDKE